MQIKRFLILAVLSLLAVPKLISAYSYGGFGGGWGTSLWGSYNSPLYYLQNPWVLFGIFFMIFFAIIYITINKSFKNPSASMVIGAGLSLLISLTLAQRGYIDTYLGGQLGGWLLLVVALIAIGFAIKFSYETFGRLGAAVAIMVVWYIIHNTDPYQLLPSEILNDAVMQIYELAASFWGLIILIIISAILITARSQRGRLRLGEISDSLFGRG